VTSSSDAACGGAMRSFSHHLRDGAGRFGAKRGGAPAARFGWGACDRGVTSRGSKGAKAASCGSRAVPSAANGTALDLRPACGRSHLQTSGAQGTSLCFPLLSFENTRVRCANIESRLASASLFGMRF
jgi:hypothetical protein